MSLPVTTVVCVPEVQSPQFEPENTGVRGGQSGQEAVFTLVPEAGGYSPLSEVVGSSYSGGINARMIPVLQHLLQEHEAQAERLQRENRLLQEKLEEEKKRFNDVFTSRELLRTELRHSRTVGAIATVSVGVGTALIGLGAQSLIPSGMGGFLVAVGSVFAVLGGALSIFVPGK